MSVLGMSMHLDASVHISLCSCNTLTLEFYSVHVFKKDKFPFIYSLLWINWFVIGVNLPRRIVVMKSFFNGDVINCLSSDSLSF